MTTTEVDEAVSDDQSESDLVPAMGAEGRPHTALLEPSENPRREAMRTRVLLPLLLPLLSAVAIAFFTLNLSRVLLAGGSTGSLILASIISVVILAGAAWISSQPRLSTATLAFVVAGFLGLIGAMGLTTLGPSEPDHEGTEEGYVPPKGEPVGTLDVVAEANTTFDADSYTAPEGIVRINYVLGGGNHTLLFDEPELRGFILAVNPAQRQDSSKVELAAGTYTIYCNIPSHRASGMEATITVR